MQVELLTSAEAIAPWAVGWDQLASGAPFRGFTWNSLWWRHYGAGAELFVCLLKEGDQLVGLAPFARDVETLRGRVLRLLGSGEVCSDYLGILCRPGREPDVAKRLAEFLSERALDWDALELVGVDAEEPTVMPLVTALAERGAAVEQRPGLNCWRLELGNDFESYVASLSKSHRKQVRRVIDRQLDSGRAVMKTAHDEATFEQGWRILVELHQKRRQSLGEPGCFSSPRFAAFHQEAARELLKRGQLRLHWVELLGEPIAAEYHLQGAGVVYAYQSGLDPDRLDEEPGRIAALCTLRAAMEQGLAAFDFLRGDEPYKAHFRAEPRPTCEWRIAAPRRAARMRQEAALAARRLRGWLRQRLRGGPTERTKGH